MSKCFYCDTPLVNNTKHSIESCVIHLNRRIIKLEKQNELLIKALEIAGIIKVVRDDTLLATSAISTPLTKLFDGNYEEPTTASREQQKGYEGNSKPYK